MRKMQARKKCTILKVKQLGQKPEKVQTKHGGPALGHNGDEDRDPKGAARMSR